MATWPATLPQNGILEEYQEQTDTRATARTEMQGPIIRQRQRTTNRPIRIACTLYAMTLAQVAILDQFYADNAALTFDWVHPRTQAAAVMRFVEAPAYSAVTRRLMSAALVLEIV